MDLAVKLWTKLPVWQYFGLAVDEDKCSNTSHLLSHLKNRYPLKFVEIRQAKSVEKPTTSCSCGQIMIDVALSKGEKYCRSLKQWELLTDLVTHLSFVDCWTLSYLPTHKYLWRSLFLCCMQVWQHFITLLNDQVYQKFSVVKYYYSGISRTLTYSGFLT